MQLPRLLMRGARWVMGLALLMALAVGLWRANRDMRDELEGATALAEVSALLIGAATLGDDELLRRLERAESSSEFRHLRIRVRDAAGRVLIESSDEPVSAPLGMLIRLSDALVTPPTSKMVAVSLPRPGGGAWTMQWIASHASEQREALTQLMEDMVELAVCAGLLLLVMRWHIRRSFRPLAPLLASIRRAGHEDLGAMRKLPRMPIFELEVIARALRGLAEALDKAEQHRRVLGTQVLTLQEEERGRIARDLHDELGQQLTAMSADAAWLQRRTAGEPEVSAVAAGLGRQCARIQQAVRSLLTRLRPMGVDGEDGSAHVVKRLQALLEALVRSWSEQPGSRTRFDIDFSSRGIAPETPLPLETMLTIYRISQEALTNVARHASAGQAWLRVHLERQGADVMVAWTVQDDGRGADLAHAGLRGNGLAGLEERVWAAGGKLEIGPLHDTPGRAPGLRLHARWSFPLPA